jgi:hypothetical protein
MVYALVCISVLAASELTVREGLRYAQLAEVAFIAISYSAAAYMFTAQRIARELRARLGLFGCRGGCSPRDAQVLRRCACRKAAYTRSSTRAINPTVFSW